MSDSDHEAAVEVVECECGTLWKPSHFDACPDCEMPKPVSEISPLAPDEINAKITLTPPKDAVAREWWTNFMGMEPSQQTARDSWPKAEWEDIRCYVERNDHVRLITQERAKFAALVEALKRVDERIEGRRLDDNMLEALREDFSEVGALLEKWGVER